MDRMTDDFVRLHLINPSNPLVSIVRLEQSRWNRYRVWQPLGLMVLAGLTPPEWDVTLLGHVKLTTATVFDAGVYLIVVGLLFMVFEGLGESLRYTSDGPEDGAS